MIEKPRNFREIKIKTIMMSITLEISKLMIIIMHRSLLILLMFDHEMLTTVLTCAIAFYKHLNVKFITFSFCKHKNCSHKDGRLSKTSWKNHLFLQRDKFYELLKFVNILLKPGLLLMLVSVLLNLYLKLCLLY